MPRHIGDRHLGLLCQRFDVPRRLCEQVEQFKTPLAGQRLPHTGKLRIKAVLESAVTHNTSIRTGSKHHNYSIDRLTS